MMLAALLVLAQALSDQTVLSLCESRLTHPEVEFLLLEARGGRLLAARWPGADQAVAAGSLAKPFTALAWAGGHGYRYPEHVCAGGCWRRHGRVGIVEALAQSCNVYFDRLAREAAPEDRRAVEARFDLGSPLAIARAYAELARRAGEPGVDPILRGLAAAAARGTARAMGGGALAKTGTAPCSHVRRAPGDGFAVALFPEREPQYVLLVRLHGAPGSAAAGWIGKVLRTLR